MGQRERRQARVGAELKRDFVCFFFFLFNGKLKYVSRLWGSKNKMKNKKERGPEVRGLVQEILTRMRNCKNN